MANTERDSHLFDPGPKRILSLDGGGVRGVVALAFLERLEQLLTARHGPEYRLCQHFDLIGGTSTGAIIASALALGMSVPEVIAAYMELARAGFRGSSWHAGVVVPRYSADSLRAVLNRHMGQETLGSDRLRTGLAIVAKRIDTGSVWVFHNNPRGPFYAPDGQDQTGTANRDLPLTQLLRASSAAPTFFAPEHIEVAKGVGGVFVDGGVSPHDNPALLLFMLATIGGYGFRWPIGAERLQLVSVGTGYRPMAPDMLPGAAAPSVMLAVTALRSVMADCSSLAQAMLQWMGSTPTPWKIDSEVGDLSQDQLGSAPMLHYLRYDLVLERTWLATHVGPDIGAAEIARLGRMDDPDQVPRLLELARLAAGRQIRTEDIVPTAMPG